MNIRKKSCRRIKSYGRGSSEDVKKEEKKGKEKKLISRPLSIKPRVPGNFKEMRKMLDIFIILQRRW